MATTDISVIVPLYHGLPYLDQMIKQVESAAKEYDGVIELLFINDNPRETIGSNLSSPKMNIRVYNSAENCGIHGSRVKGLSLSSGTHIVFLDQDDKIEPAYFKSQMEKGKDADAVVCRIIDGSTPYYNQARRLEDCICREAMTQKGNDIVSPGQVLLKKEAVSSFWISNLLTYNGADDWFLWICMLCEGKRFHANEDMLFYHVKHEKNASSNSLSMFDSISEVYEKLKGNICCTSKDLEGISGIVRSHEIRFLKERDKFLAMYVLMDRWMTVREQGKTIAETIQKAGFCRAAVYGRGRFGIRAAKELTENGIEVCYFIDKNAAEPFDHIKTIAPEDVRETELPVIITLVKEEAKEVALFLEKKGAGQLYLIEDMIMELEETGGKKSG